MTVGGIQVGQVSSRKHQSTSKEQKSRESFRQKTDVTDGGGVTIQEKNKIYVRNSIEPSEYEQEIQDGVRGGDSNKSSGVPKH